ncbi:8-oxo-dGTP diphosphatase [Microterricola viridarii]|uniref:Oxidized purine nucleoside triphosphate hydrolase n=1 Tax=Microterricola viridarii TaxID=412690 RepID=A0A1H1SGI8_9MICO|nr:8-oxo-dGTP diphosphatase [Microterricola viridarii]SDS47115.1 8-oxo-dGTP diphosphatase [Microterricola viridarii]
MDPAPLPQVCVVYLLRTDERGIRQVLLGRKKLGLGQGNFVAPGGKLEPGESPADAAVREVAEEAGVLVAPADLQSRGMLDYFFPHRESWSQRSHVFVCERWTGIPRESNELNPEWVDLDAVPYAEMWDDARFWLPEVLAGGEVRRDFTFGEDLASVVDATLSAERPQR